MFLYFTFSYSVIFNTISFCRSSRRRHVNQVEFDRSIDFSLEIAACQISVKDISNDDYCSIDDQSIKVAYFAIDTRSPSATGLGTYFGFLVFIGSIDRLILIKKPIILLFGI